MSNIIQLVEDFGIAAQCWGHEMADYSDYHLQEIARNKLIKRDNILVKALKAIVACEGHWRGAEMQENYKPKLVSHTVAIAEKALRDIGEME